MEYESRQIKWYWFLLFLMYCGAVSYLLFSGNPYLYSHQELKAALSSGNVLQKTAIPEHVESNGKVSAVTYFTRYNFEHTGVDPLGTPRLRDYSEFEKHEVQTGIPDFDVKNIVSDSSGFYISGKGPWVVAVGVDGQTRWKFRFRSLSQDRSLWPVLLDETSAYLVHPGGEIVCLNKNDGSIRWVLETDQEIVGMPFLWKDHVIVPTKKLNAIQMILVKRGNGARENATPQIDIKPTYILSDFPAQRSLIAVFDNKVVAINPETWELTWSQLLTDPIKGPAVVVDNMVYVATLGAKVIKIDGSKKGKIDWECDLEKPPASAPSFVPAVNRLTILDTSGTLSSIDVKTGKIAWTYSTENKNPLVDTWSVRLSAKYIEEFKMDWLHKGWTVFSPCATKKFCIFTPNKGQIIEKVQLSGAPLTLPLQFERRWVFLTQSKPGQLSVSHIVEENEIKKLKGATARSAEEH